MNCLYSGKVLSVVFKGVPGKLCNSLLNELHLQLFETEFTDSHNASADVEACARCYFELRKRGIIE